MPSKGIRLHNPTNNYMRELVLNIYARKCFGLLAGASSLEELNPGQKRLPQTLQPLLAGG